MEAITFKKERESLDIGKNSQFDCRYEKGQYFEVVNKKKQLEKVSESEIMCTFSGYYSSYIAFLERKTVSKLISFIGILKNNKVKVEGKIIPKERQLFLKIKLSNLNKIVGMVKMQAFILVKRFSGMKIKQRKKRQMIKVEVLINLGISRLLNESFYRIKNAKEYSKNVVKIENQQNSDDQDQEHILIESYKVMAMNLSRLQTAKKTANPISDIKKKMSTKTIFTFFSQKYISNLIWAFMDIYCYQNHRYTQANLHNLQREIEILKQQYDSV